MEFAISFVAEYSGVLAPAIAFWAALMLHLQPKDCNSGMIQTHFFFSLLVVAVLTVRATTNHDPMWLANAASLGVLIVAGVLKRPTGELESLAIHSEA